jgi:hypothetical protein
MKPRLILVVLLSIASLSSASMLFLDSPKKSSIVRSTPPSLIDIKWGEGVESGIPHTAAHN